MRVFRIGAAMSVTAVVAGAFVTSTPAAAQGSPHLVQFGWWLIANYDPTATAPYSAPDAPDLHIGYGPNPDGVEKQDPNSPVNGPTEVSAVQYKLPDALPEGVDATVAVAQLKFPVDTSYTPTVSPQASLLACPSLDPWDAVQGGNWQARVTYDTSGCAAGVYDSTANTFTFTITDGMLQSQQIIDVAIVPGFVPIGLCNVPMPVAGVPIGGCTQPDPNNPPQAPWSLDLKQPTDAAATALPVSASSLPSDFSLPSQDTSVPAALGIGALPPASVIGGAPPAPSAAPAGAKPGYTVPTSLAGGAARVPSLGRERLLAVVLLLLLLLGGLLLMSLDVQRLLTPAGQAGGLGRFARQRSGPPIPI